MFELIDFIEYLVDQVDNLIRLIFGFFDMIADAFVSIRYALSFAGDVLAYVPSEVAAFVMCSIIGSVGAFAMW